MATQCELGLHVVTFRQESVLISEGKSCREQKNRVLISEGPYNRGPYIRVFVSNHKEQLWQGHPLGCPYRRSPIKRRPYKRIRL